MNYIVSGPGRVGGNLLVSIIRSSGQQSVHHTHDPLLSVGNDRDTTLIVLDRKNRFDAILSNAIVHRTGQATEYPKTRVEPFELEPGVFRWGYVKHLDYYRGHDLSRPYAAVFKLYFEDFVSDPGYVKRLLNLSAVDSGYRTPAAPYNYRDVITNWEKLHRLFSLLEEDNNERNNSSQHS